MKRDMDLIRAIVLKLESLEKTTSSIATFKDFPIAGFTPDQISYHVQQLINAGWIDTGGRGPLSGFHFRCLTWSGHDFADSVRDDDIWAKTKDGALAAGGYSLELLKDLAKGFIRKKLAQHTGVDL